MAHPTFSELLIYALRLSEHPERVLGLGYGAAPTLHEALEQWVMQQFQHPDPDLLGVVAPLLIRRLQLALSEGRDG